MPVEGGVLEAFMRDPEKKRIAQLVSCAMLVLVHQLSQAVVCTTSQLAVKLAELEDSRVPALAR